MIKVQKEISNFITKYVSVDGIEFDSEEECLKYENSAKGILRDKFKKLIIRECDAWSLMAGYDDHIIYYVKFIEESDIDTLMQYYYLQNPCILQKEHENIRQSYIKKARDAFNRGVPLLMGCNCDDEIYFIQPLDVIINNLNNYSEDD